MMLPVKMDDIKNIKTKNDTPSYRSVATPLSRIMRKQTPAPKYNCVPNVSTEFEKKVNNHHRGKRINDILGPIWNISGDIRNLPGLPLYYEKNCSVRIRLTSPSIIAQRISSCLQKISAIADFCREQAKAKVINIDQVVYIVRLFRARSIVDKDTEDDDVIVEVQRRQGDALSFIRDCNIILRAATCDKIEEDIHFEDLCNRNFDTPPIPSSFMSKYLHIIENENENKRVQNSLRDISRMLKEENMLDEIILGMQHLRSLTDPKFSFETAFAASAFMPQEIIEKLRNVVVYPQKELNSNNNFDPVDVKNTRKTQVEENYNMMIYIQALQCLTNMFSVANASILQNISAICYDDLIPALLDIMRRAERLPHEAYLSCKCVNAILGTNDKFQAVREKLLKLGALTVIGKLQQIGKCRHALLEQESGMIFSILIKS